MLEIGEDRRGGIVVVALKGRLDSNTAGQLEEKLIGLIDGGDKLFVLDCLFSEYISSAGLRVLLMAAKKLKAVNGKIALHSLNGHIKGVFEIVGFTSIFPICEREDQALQSLQ